MNMKNTTLSVNPGPKAHGVVVLLSVILALIASYEVLACSSFLLKKDGAYVAGRNLDSNKFTSGAVVVNNRGVRKESRSWSELAYGQEVENPHITWVSKYGSIAFNTFGRDFVDGGMNEAGLFIQEMSLVENQYPEDPTKPRFFMMLWMQYVLDNFESVDQIVDSANSVIIDGWNWHFFAADAAGNTAAIEFVAGKPVLTYGKAMPITVLANETYATEMDRLLKYEGFGGDKRVILKDDERQRDPDEPIEDDRFVNAATLINRSPDSPLPPLDYGMKILEEMAWDGTQWSYVCDLTNKTIQFRTKDSPELKTLRLADFDFGPDSPTLMMDIHLAGEIGPDSFSEYSPELNRAQLNKKISSWDSVFTSNGATLEEALDRIGGYPETTETAVTPD